MVLALLRLAHIMKQHREVKNEGSFDPLEQFCIRLVGRSRGATHAVEVFEADQRVLVRRVEVVEFMLNEAIELFKFRHEPAEDA